MASMAPNAVVRGAGALRVGAITVAVAIAVSSVGLLVQPGPESSFAARDDVGWFVISAGFAVLAAGIALIIARKGWVSGPLVVGASVAWFAPIWVGAEALAPAARIVASAVAMFAVPLCLQVLLGMPDGRVRRRSARVAAVSAYAIAASVGLVRVLLYEPYFDESCWAICRPNPFLLARADAFVAVVGSASTAAWMLATVFAAILIVRRAAAAPLGRRGVDGMAAAAAVLLATAASARWWVGSAGATDDPETPMAVLAVGIEAIALLTMAVALVTAVALRRRRVAALDAIIAESSAASVPGAPEQALARALKDPKLRIDYSRSAPGLADDLGRFDAPWRQSGPQESTLLTRGAKVIAHVTHTVPREDLTRELGPAMLLAIENEALRVELESHLAALRASRSRIVANSDEHRRLLERDLHDGAQQRLLILTHTLQSAAARAGRVEDPAEAQLIDAIRLTRAALRDLRELAHGIFPTVLLNAGLTAALRSLAVDAGAPVEFGELDESRPEPAVEAALYGFVAEAAERARTRGSPLVVSTVRTGETVTVKVAGMIESPPTHILDRIGAVGGTVDRIDGGFQAVV
jgi:signal transduction histidine kinase